MSRLGQIVFNAQPLMIVAAFVYCATALAVPSDPAAPIPPPNKINNTAEPLTGTLFFNRQQRDQIDRTRKGGNLVLEDASTVSPTPPVKPPPAIINGFVKRSDGNNTVWVDGAMKRNLSQNLFDEIEPMSVGGATKIDRTKGADTKPASLIAIRHKKHTVLPHKQNSIAKAQVNKNLTRRHFRGKR